MQLNSCCACRCHSIIAARHDTVHSPTTEPAKPLTEGQLFCNVGVLAAITHCNLLWPEVDVEAGSAQA